MSTLKKSIATGLIAVSLASGAVATSSPAAAWYRGGWGGPLAAGAIGGLALGAIVGSTSHPYGYGGYGYAPYGYGYGPTPVYSPCYRGRTPVYDAYGNFAGYRPVRICD